MWKGWFCSLDAAGPSPLAVGSVAVSCLAANQRYLSRSCPLRCLQYGCARTLGQAPVISRASFHLPLDFLGGASLLPGERICVKREGGSPGGVNAAPGAVASRDGHKEGKVTWKTEPQQVQPMWVVASSLLRGSVISRKFVPSLSNRLCPLGRAAARLPPPCSSSSSATHGLRWFLSLLIATQSHHCLLSL